MSDEKDDRSNQRRTDVDAASRYGGWIIGGLFVLAVVVATFAFLGRDAETAFSNSPDRGATGPSTVPKKASRSTTGAR